MDSKYNIFLKSLDIESRILLLCSQTVMTRQHIDTLRILSLRNPNWDAICYRTITHRVLPLVYKNLKSYVQECLPSSIFKDLHLCFQRLCGRNVLMTLALEKCVKTLKQQSIESIPFKGPVLAALFGDIVCRQFGDIDILVHRKDVCASCKALETIGYYPQTTLSESQLIKLTQTDNEFPLTHYKTGLIVDLQWELTGGYFKNVLEINDLKSSLHSLKLINYEVQTFTGEYLLLYLCIHGNQHVWQQLENVCCVNEAIRVAPGLNWTFAMQKARELGAYRMLSVGVMLAHLLFGTDVPKSVISDMEVETKKAGLINDRLQKILISANLRNCNSTSSHRFDPYHYKSLDSRRAAAKYAFHLFFSPTRHDWEKKPLPSKYSFLHYFFRPVRLVSEWLNQTAKQ